MNSKADFRIEFFGESGLLVIFGERIDSELNRKVHLLAEWLAQKSIAGITDVIPAYASLLIVFDPLKCTHDLLQTLIEQWAQQGERSFPRTCRLVEVPVIYGGDFGPDLNFVAGHCGLSVDEVIRIHSQTEYSVFMMGFSPGFPYLGGMNPAIAAPRLQTPRPKVPAGSVGIAGQQTGIYPSESPGGWRLIGWTPLKLFDPEGEPPFLLEPGDRVRFCPIEQEKA